MDGGRHRPSRAARGLALGTGPLTGLWGAVAIGFGIPLAWVWIASQLAGTHRELTPSLAILITTGILVSYWVALLFGRGCANWIGDGGARPESAHVLEPEFQRPAVEPGRPGKRPGPASLRGRRRVAIILFEVWFFFFAGSPAANQPAVLTGPPRLTRKEKRAETRARLLDAAEQVFLRRGLQGSSVEEIAAEAGFTRGAFYSNFKSKEELFVELLQDRVYRQYAGSRRRRRRSRDRRASGCAGESSG